MVYISWCNLEAIIKIIFSILRGTMKNTIINW